ncbi:TSUP family transporter [Sneathiella sp.]|jgi:uncharacterized membrane protein YfcA|uniref:TSUP family transporter n=1 Tax=Sneathiella sp. TaxID=1964365 RepID=UPI0039E582F5
MTFFLLMVSGLFLAIWAVNIAGAFFLAVPILEFLLPLVGYAQLMALFKVGSLGWGISSGYATRKQVNWQQIKHVAPALLTGSIAGVFLINQITRDVIPFVIVGAILFIELIIPAVSRFDLPKNRTLLIAAAFLIGIYGSSISAGFGLLTLALFRLAYPGGDSIARASIQARVCEFLCVLVTVLVHLLYGNIVFFYAIALFSGTLFGGLIGWKLLVRLTFMPAKTQRYFLYGVYGFALFTTFQQPLSKTLAGFLNF